MPSSLLLFDWACSCPFQHHCHIYQFIHLHLKPCKRIRRVKKPMWLKRKIKNSKSWNCFQEKNVKGKLTVAQKAEMQAEKKANHQKVSSDLLRPLSAWWGAESSAESLGLTDSWAQGRVGRVNEFCAPTWTAENQGFLPPENSVFLGKKEGKKGALTRASLQDWSCCGRIYSTDEINRQWAFSKKYKGWTAELWPAYATSHFKHFWYWRSEGWFLFFLFHFF